MIGKIVRRQLESRPVQDSRPEGFCLMHPIGFIHSIFQFKNGTPRQSLLCASAQGSLSIEKTVFNNPQHSLQGLEQFSHAWLMFVFHKNNKVHTKAKVRPPRMNGQKVGVFATRSPYRPNAIGLTLARIERITGHTIYFSGIDLVDGTPVLDIKPFIPQYDSPFYNHDSASYGFCQSTVEGNGDNSKNSSASYGLCQSNVERNEDIHKNSSSIAWRESTAISMMFDDVMDSKSQEEVPGPKTYSLSVKSIEETSWKAKDNRMVEEVREKQPSVVSLKQFPLNMSSLGSDPCASEILEMQQVDPSCSGQSHNVDLQEKEGCHEQNSSVEQQKNGQSLDASSSIALPPNIRIASWLSSLNKLTVLFTDRALWTLHQLSTDLKLLAGPTDLQAAIVSVLSEDPRSVYRRKKCQDSLYFFSLDTVHITCWFDQNIVEVLKLQPLSSVQTLAMN